ncbi:MAG TPA: LuxR C-terminal-related transcriptional regulator [Candidatus Saccharimonadales bacterium]|nr:LuxR C-terminal-related transcriptional regulator [Candidatus Saccharimonadales bacterium]
MPVTIVERDKFLPFKEERTAELVEDFKVTRDRDGWGNGQDNPLLAAMITGEAAPSLEVYDGLHRQVANELFQSRYGIEVDRPATVLQAIGHTAVHFVTVKPMTRAEMLDKRLTNTRNHPELRFDRGGLWSAQLWYLDDISSLAPHITARQAFGLAERKDAGLMGVGRQLGLDPEVTEKIVVWAQARAEAWSVDPSTISKWIQRTEATTPEIVAMVRNVGKGNVAHSVVTEQMLQSLATFMGEEAYKPVHGLIVKFALTHDLNRNQFSNLVSTIARSETFDPTDTVQVGNFLDKVRIDELDATTFARSERRIRRRTDIYKSGGQAIQSLSDALERVAESLDVRHERTNFVPDVDQKRAAIEAAERLEREAEKALKLAERARASVQGTATQQRKIISNSDFNPADFSGKLSEAEIEVLELSAQGLTIAEIAMQLCYSESSIKARLTYVYDKLGAADKTVAVLRSIQLGVLHIPNLSPNVAIAAKTAPSSKESATTSEDKSIDTFAAQLKNLANTQRLCLSTQEIRELVGTFMEYVELRRKITALEPLLKSIVERTQHASNS